MSVRLSSRTCRNCACPEKAHVATPPRGCVVHEGCEEYAPIGKEAAAEIRATVAARTPRRHRWFKLEEHRYVCWKCGTFRKNQLRGGQWHAIFDKPDGYIVDQEPPRTPRCEAGPRTIERLRAAGLPDPGEGL